MIPAPLVAKLFPWIFGGLSVALLYSGWMTSAYLGKRDDLSAAVAECDARIAAGAAEAERRVTEALRAAHRRDLEAMEERLEQAANARARAVEDRIREMERAESAIGELERIRREIEESENAPLERVCATVDMPVDIRMQYDTGTVPHE